MVQRGWLSPPGGSSTIHSSNGVSRYHARASQCRHWQPWRHAINEHQQARPLWHCTPCASAAQVQQKTLESDRDTQLRNLCLEVPVAWPDHPGCVLVVRPLSLEWRAPVAELLTSAFVETDRLKPFRTLLKQRISSYLEGQAKLFPRTLILTATLRPASQATTPEQTRQAAPDPLHAAPVVDEAHTEAHGSRGTRGLQHGSNGVPQAHGTEHAANRTGHGTYEACTPLQHETSGHEHQIHNGTTGMPALEREPLSSSVGHETGHPHTEDSTVEHAPAGSQRAASSLDWQAAGNGNRQPAPTDRQAQASSQPLQTVPGIQPAPTDNHTQASSQSAQAAPTTDQLSTDSQASEPPPSWSASTLDAMPGMDILSQSPFSSAAAQPPSPHAVPAGVPAVQGEVLVGTVEVSWDRRTHSMNLTLNPPAKAAYLCNMAVQSSWRRRGVGQLLIRGVEEACRIMDEDQLFLHLRFQDAAATALYRAAGFEQAKADWWIVKLLGQDQQRLMRKQVPRGHQESDHTEAAPQDRSKGAS